MKWSILPGQRWPRCGPSPRCRVRTTEGLSGGNAPRRTWLLHVHTAESIRSVCALRARRSVRLKLQPVRRRRVNSQLPKSAGLMDCRVGVCTWHPSPASGVIASLVPSSSCLVFSILCIRRRPRLIKLISTGYPWLSSGSAWPRWWFGSTYAARELSAGEPGSKTT
ncbi:hypothetical protein L226DRAFT_338306 [Lentinus tigrinus ALCF2SS1-7]|uniref:Uncharacterized protein n=1 Tax=Lentinus tigrinus ALCF2SS1-6 TaxID=1328759 RepID=A0A5C2SG62_9APHY|nr:hypothetical protein L227DRAFT_30240 [Lentinus tigrinus ALCF2SS1-6]RPD77976.1 hypothetical protein L226DRAFT_338306 [Lentinus tigrinus ALCF2SS1-7]